MTSVRRKVCPAQKNRAFKALIGPSSYQSDRSDYKDPLGSNKSGLLKACTSKTPASKVFALEAPTSEALTPKTPVSKGLKLDIT